MADMDVSLLKGITQEHCRRTNDYHSRTKAEGAVAVVLEVLYNTPQSNPMWQQVYRAIADSYVETPRWRESPGESIFDEFLAKE